MIDYFVLALTHALLILAVFRILGRDDLDHEPELDTKRKRVGDRLSEQSPQERSGA